MKKLKNQLLLTALAGLFFLAFAIYFYSYYSQKKIFTNEFKKNTKNITETIQLGLEIGLENENFKTIQRIFNWSKKKNVLKWIIITDSNGDLFANYPTNYEFTTEQLNHLLVNNDVANELYLTSVNWSSQIEHGQIWIAFSTNEFLMAKNELMKNLFVGITMIFFLLLIGVFIVSDKISKPLSNLEDVSKSIANGDMKIRTNEKEGCQEIINVAESFNKMMNILETTQKLLKEEEKKSNDLLLNTLPKKIIERLKVSNETIADSHENISVLFADLVGFTALASKVTPEKLVEMLNIIFTRFDEAAEKYKVEKIKTIGDNYMAASGLWNSSHPERNIVAFAMEILKIIEIVNQEYHLQLSMRVGVHSGPLVAGVLGNKTLAFDLWGDTVNTASRLESNSEPGKIAASKNIIFGIDKQKYKIIERGPIHLKGKGEMDVFYIQSL